MPKKKTVLTDEQRAKNIRAVARKIGTDNSPEAFEKAFKKVVVSGPKAPTSPSAQRKGSSAQ